MPTIRRSNPSSSTNTTSTSSPQQSTPGRTRPQRPTPTTDNNINNRSSSNPSPASSSPSLQQLLHDQHPSYISRIRNSHSLNAPLTEAETSIRENTRRSLRRSYRQITTSVQCDWLFASPDTSFHTSLSSSSFPSSLAAVPSFEDGLVLQQTSANEGSSSSSRYEALFLVPVAVHNNRLLGYTFGMRSSQPRNFASGSAMFGHDVGRFSFHPQMRDLLFVAYARNDVFVGHVKLDAAPSSGSPTRGRRGGRSSNRTRMRRSFVLSRGSSDRPLPEDDVVAMTESVERRVADTDQFQFVSIRPSSIFSFTNLTRYCDCRNHHHHNISDADIDVDCFHLLYGHERLPQHSGSTATNQNRTRTSSSNSSSRAMQQAMLNLERLVRGRFTSDAVVHDTLDERTGRLIERRTGPENTEFGIQDAVQLRITRDVAIRRYFTYVSNRDRTSTQTAVEPSQQQQQRGQGIGQRRGSTERVSRLRASAWCNAWCT